MMDISDSRLAAWLALGAAVIVLLYALFLIGAILRLPSGNQRMQEIALAIRQGAAAYLKRQYQAVAWTGLILALLIWWQLDWRVALAFLFGASLSALAGFIGVAIAVQANVRTAEMARRGLAGALATALKAGSVTGFFVVGLALLAVSVLFLLGADFEVLIGLGFGGSLISVFARLGGGIYTKGADVGADLVGKLEAGIPEDDPRNPAVIADNVGDNVGDCAGMAADLFETYVITLVATMLLGHLLLQQEVYLALPLLFGAAAVLASLFGSFFTWLRGRAITAALYRSLWVAGLLALLAFYFLTRWLLPADQLWPVLAVSLIGLAVTALIFLITEYYTSYHFSPVKTLAQASTSGHATNLIAGLALSLRSTFWPVVIVTLATLVSFQLFGLYGVALAALAMLSLTGTIVALDAYGPVTDNAGGIAEMAALPRSVRKATEALDAVGNTTKAVTKGFAITSAALSALVLFNAYFEELMLKNDQANFAITNPYLIAGLLLGALLPYLFASLAMGAVGQAAQAVVGEVRRQFKEIKGLVAGRAKPDYARAVDLVTRAALKQMLLPSLLPVLFPVLVGFLLGPVALGGVLIGSIISGLFVALSMTTGGAAWDNAKKFIELGHFGGKGSPAHAAAVTGDAVGDPYKDTAGPAINPVIKVVNIVALLIVPLLG